MLCFTLAQNSSEYEYLLACLGTGNRQLWKDRRTWLLAARVSGAVRNASSGSSGTPVTCSTGDCSFQRVRNGHKLLALDHVLAYSDGCSTLDSSHSLVEKFEAVCNFEPLTLSLNCGPSPNSRVIAFPPVSVQNMENFD